MPRALRAILVVGAVAVCLSPLFVRSQTPAAPAQAVAGGPKEPKPASAAADYAGQVQPFLQKHCFDCHGPAKQNSQIRFDQLTTFNPADQHLWTMVYEEVSGGSMPPEDRPRPSDAEKTRVLRWIERQQKQVTGGGTRRLNRRELSAALRDVTGLNVDFSFALPDDGKVNGFDTGAEGLQDAADSVAQIMQVTRRAVDALRFLEPPTGLVVSADLTKAKDARHGLDPWKSKNVSYSGGDTFGMLGTGLLIKPKWLGDRGGLSFRLPLPPSDARLGVVRVVVQVSTIKGAKGVPNPQLWVEVGGRDLDYVEVSNPPDQPRTLVYEVHLGDVAMDAKGINIQLTNRVEMPYAVDGFPNDERSKPGEELPGGTGLFRPQFDQKKLPPKDWPVPFVVVHSVEIASDHRVAWPPESWKADVGTIADSPASAARLLSLWMERAWRRPVAPAEQTRFLTLYEKLRGQGLGFDEALRAAFQSVLLSGSFRYLPSPTDLSAAPSSATADVHHAIASRLSFMLWGTPPDAELRRLAHAKKLRDPTVIGGQVDRLLADPRSEAFVRPFVTQWLEMGQPITLAMDHLQKQDFRFGRHLKESMRQETIGYVGRLLTDNRPATQLVQSDWTMMNDILARHYGYPPLEGGHLRPVTLRKDDPRGGGILGHAGIQSMLCWMGENWVIYRGAWALRHVLDAPPPPPPLEVPELIPSDGKNRGKSFRELLVQHQEDSRCSVCHKSIDPMGFAFQNFDLSGRWRDVEYERYVTAELDGKIEWRGTGKTRPVDATGALPRGERFQSFAECKALIAAHYAPDVVRGLLKNLHLYATGRQADVAAMTEFRKTIQRLEPAGYPLRDLVKSVVTSKAFLGE